MKIDYYYDKFINYLKSEKDISNLTAKSYQNGFNGITPKLESITTPIIRRYITNIKTEKNFKTATIRSRIHSFHLTLS